MQISLRSHMIAGTTALVGATAIAMTPIAPAVSLPSLSVTKAAVALSAFDSPLAQLSTTFALANQYLTNDTSNVALAASWPNSGFGTATWGVPPTNYPLLPAALETAALGGYSSVGLVSQFIDDALPIISQLGYNGLNYLNVTGNALSVSGIALGQGIWTAVGQLLALNISGALTALSTAVTTAGTALLAAGSYVFNGVLANAQAVVATVLGDLPTALQVAVGQAQIVAAQATTIVTNSLTALSLGNIESAWNYAVDGLLGASGIPGTLLNLSIGAGVQYAPIATPDAAGIAAAFMPSTRTVVQTFVKDITTALQTPNPAPPVPSPVAATRSAAAARTAASVAAPAATASAAEAPAADSSDAPAPAKKAAARGGRNAAAAKAAAAK